MSSTNEVPDILRLVGAVPLDSDRQTLVHTIDKATSEVVKALDKSPSGQEISSALRENTLIALQFFESCSKLGDPSFQMHIRKRAKEVKAALHTATKRASEPPKTEPPETSASESAPDGTDGPEAAPAEEDDGQQFSNFNEAFSHYLLEFLRDRLSCFHVADPSPPVPYVLSETFTENFLEAVAAHMVPTMLENRRVQTISQNTGKDKLNRETLYKEFERKERENVTMLLWKSRLDELKSALSKPSTAAKTGAKKQDKKGGLLEMIPGFGKKPEKKKTGPTPEDAKRKAAEGFWSKIAGPDAAKAYDPPGDEAFELFSVFLEFDDEVIAKHQNALRQLLEQQPGEDEEPGSGTRNYLESAVDLTAPHCGEILTLWTYNAFPERFTDKILKSFLVGQATTPTMRRQAMPVLMRWVPDPSEMQEPEPEKK